MEASELEDLLNSAINILDVKSGINSISLHRLLSLIIRKLTADKENQKMAAKVPVSVMDWFSKCWKKDSAGNGGNDSTASKKPAWMMLDKAAQEQKKEEGGVTNKVKDSPWGKLTQAMVQGPPQDPVKTCEGGAGKDLKKEVVSPADPTTQNNDHKLIDALRQDLSNHLEKVESLLWGFEGRNELGLPPNKALVKGSESLRNKVENNELDINKLISIYEELHSNIREMEKEMKFKNELYAQKMEDMISKITDCQDASANLQENITIIELSVDKFSIVAENGIVTWTNLEKALHQQSNLTDSSALDKPKQSLDATRSENEINSMNNDEDLDQLSPKLKASLKELGLVAEGYKDLLLQNESLKTSLDFKEGKLNEMDDLISQMNTDMEALTKNYDKNSEEMKQLKKNLEKNDEELQHHLQSERESGVMAEGEAAGFRRKFNCISCDSNDF